MGLFQIIQLILGTAENIIPLFIHNPKSQQVEAVVVGTAQGLSTALAGLPAPATPTNTLQQGASK